MRLNKSLKIVFGILAVTLVIGIAVAAKFYYDNLRGAGPAFRDPSDDITKYIPMEGSPASNTTNMPLKLPEGFSISIFAKDLPGARVVAFDGDSRGGVMYVSQTSEGKITALTVNQNGQVTDKHVLLKNLSKPHGLAILNSDLYYAEENKISKVRLYSEGSPIRIADLPGGGEHFTRTLGFGPDGRLYVSIGSSCNACIEKDSRRAAIYRMNKDGNGFEQVAKGLRNSVFFTFDFTGNIWATEMGRDYLGDNLPPDEINIIGNPENASGQSHSIVGPQDFGWPICYGKNIHDSNFDKNQYVRDPCVDKTPSRIDIPAHSAPLGLAFVPEDSNWPEQYKGKLMVALHGSSMNENPVGYKIISLIAGRQSEASYTSAEDFISGWLPAGVKGRAAPKSALGRPVDLVFDQSGNLFISDDKAGVIYKIWYSGSGKTSTGEIILKNFKDNQVVKSPLVLEGEAPGKWFFEASFPVKVLDANGNVLGQGPAQAQEDWMQEGPVDFKAEVTFTPPTTETGTLVLEKDNPSGLPENAAEVRIPIKFDSSISEGVCSPGLACEVMPINSN